MIKLDQVTFEYNTVEGQVLKNVSFEVKDREWVSILGHNGSGKSTIAKLMVGLLATQSGTVSYNDVVLNDKTIDEVRQKVGIVFQNPDNQFVGYNVKYDIAFGLENRKVPREEMKSLIREYTEKVGMENELEREPQTLSGGQKQRVAIAGILAMNCETVILDEATSMLDPEGVEEITGLITELKEKYQKTIITITHDLNLAAKSDRIIVLKDGEILAQGTPKEIFMDRELLKSSHLDMPFALRFYEEAQKTDLKNNREVMEVLWEYHLKK